MRLPESAVILPEKLSRYLLVELPDSDKSVFLSHAGYTSENWPILLRDIRNQLLPLDAKLSRRTFFGDLYEIQGKLIGPNGKALSVVSIWMVEHETNQTKFITLYPRKEK